MEFTEAKLEQGFIEKHTAQSFSYVSGENIERSTDEVLTETDLRSFLFQKYEAENLTNEEVDQINCNQAEKLCYFRPV